MLNIFVTFKRSRTILDKFGNPLKSAITMGKNVNDGFLAGVAAVAVETAAVVAAAVQWWRQ